ncbi:MAG TPA: hypothetical protein PLA90_17855, partial [Candidatus Sumerlaeota bacterium]|nr:hypothetical protein [Candidatus Sumerlaeota bacterium]
LFALYTTMPADIVSKRESGAFFDLIFPYFSTRLAIRSKEDAFAFLSTIVKVGAFLSFFGVYEAVTQKNPFAQAVGLDYVHDPQYLRHGLARASLTFGNSIALGLFFSATTLIALGLYRIEKRKILSLIMAVLNAIGTLTTLSSAPFMALFASIGFLAAYPLRRHWRIGVALLLLAILVVELASNRHFYHVMTRFAFNTETAYYRIGLWDEALGGGMRNHWLFGYGYVGLGPGNDNSSFKWEHQDLVNIYIFILVRTGLCALIPYLCINYLYFRRLYQAAGITRSGPQRWFIWATSGALAGWNIAMMTVAPLEQIVGYLNMIAGICATLPNLVAHRPQYFRRVLKKRTQTGEPEPEQRLQIAQEATQEHE